MYKTIEWLDEKKAIRLLDQSVLPGEVRYQALENVESVFNAIGNMTVRGAPAIGVTAAYGLAIAAFRESSDETDAVKAAVQNASQYLSAARPTAVNLAWALGEVIRRVDQSDIESADEYREAILSCAHQMAQEDVDINRAIARSAMTLMPAEKVTFIHHCNTGSLATVDYGTALGVIRMAHETGLNVHVFVDETRPRLQGSRLTCWELNNQGISHQLIVDGASSHVMQKFAVDMCVVGCDRVAANGDVANKVGTSNLAAVARANGIPFYVAAPLSTIDLNSPSGHAIEIEERDPDEVRIINGTWVAPQNVNVYNPAFDITPADWITAIITEKGVVYPPFTEGLRSIKEA